MSFKQLKSSSILFFLLLSLVISSAKALPEEKNIEKFFDWAQSEFNVYFDSPASTKIEDIWHYRHYPNQDIYLGVNDSEEVYVVGSPFGGVLFVGMLNDLLPLVPENFVYTQVIAGTGMPAVGFPEDFIYYNVENIRIGPNGHIAFTGAADTNIRSSNANTNAVWTGHPGDLKIIIRENDTISGLPGNVLFDKSNTPPVITQSGHVAFIAQLKGAVNANNNTAILAYVNGEVKKVLQAGEPAPGFPVGTTVSHLSIGGIFSFSDAGLVISGRTNQMQPALWFWDFNSVTLLAAGHTALLNSFPLNMTLPFPYQRCDFGNFGVPLINANGTIVVNSSTILSPTEECPFNTLLKINNLNISTIFDPRVQTFENGNGVDLASFISLLNYDLNTNNGVNFYRNSLLDINNITTEDILLGISRSSSWYKPSNENQQLIALSGETLPNDYTSFLTGISSVVNNNADVAVYGTDNIRTNYILSGNPRTDSFYTSADQAAASQLSLVTKTGMQPPGLNSTDFFKKIAPPIITDSGDIIFAATIESAIDRSNYQSLWRAKSDGTLHQLIFNGQSIKSGNKDEPLSFFQKMDEIPSFRGIGNGQANQYSNVGKFVFQSALGNSRKVYQTNYYD